MAKDSTTNETATGEVSNALTSDDTVNAGSTKQPKPKITGSQNMEVQS